MSSESPSEPGIPKQPLDRSQTRIIHRRPRIDVPPDVLRRHGARLLDPDFAVTLPGQEPPEPTVYLPGVIKVTGLPGGSADARLAAVNAAAGKYGYTARFSEDDTDLAHHVAGGPHRDLVDKYWVCKVEFSPEGQGPVKQADSWKFLQQVRADATVPDGVELVHVVTACATDFEGVPAYGGHAVEGLPAYGGHGTEGLPAYGGHGEYGRPGWGVRAPVVLGLQDPRARSPQTGRRPVVCVPDTGIGRHPWFRHADGRFREGIGELSEYAGVRIGLDHDPASDPEVFGLGNALYGLLDRDSGHGTFIAGIIRQQCPTADILTVPVMTSDGSADEVVLQRALVIILLRHLEALDQQNAEGAIDVLSLSMGYYHEKPEDMLSDPVFRPLFEEFGRAGVSVVCAAGNDGTMAPLFPAAWSPGEASQAFRDVVPMVAVGAANPDGQTEALFSNVGPWVACVRPGVAVVSTMPTTFDAAEQSAIRFETREGVRASVDMDNFASGFAVWSGTSFAAPCLAGQIARRLADDSRLSQVPQVPEGSSLAEARKRLAIERAWAAIAPELGWTRDDAQH